MDVHSPEKRHYNMSKIRDKDTKPEIVVRKYLFGRGLRYRKNDNRLPGHPDMVFPRYKTVVFVNGCFWHGHEGCKFFVWPKTNTEFWKRKINGNKKRDIKNNMVLDDAGWKVITIWECELNREQIQQTLANLYCRIVDDERK